MARAFISYSREDRDKAAALAAAIEDYGHEVWWDSHLVGGDEFQHVIEEKLAQVDAIIVLWTESSVRKPWVLAEATLGLERDCLLPVRYDEKVVPPKAFAHIHAEYLGDWKGDKRAPEIGKLVERIDQLKHARDVQRLASSVPPVLRAAAEKTGFLSAFFDTALPGGLPVHRYLLGVVFAALGLWGLLMVVNALFGGVSPDIGDIDGPNPTWIGFVAGALAISRAIDQLIVASKRQSAVRFFDKSYSRTYAACFLLAVIVPATVNLLIYLRTQNLPDLSGMFGGMVQTAIELSLLLLVVVYILRLLVLLVRSLASRI